MPKEKRVAPGVKSRRVNNKKSKGRKTRNSNNNSNHSVKKTLNLSERNEAANKRFANLLASLNVKHK